MKYRLFLLMAILFLYSHLCAQHNPSRPVMWQAFLRRADGKNIQFNFEEKQVNKKTVLIIYNATERLRVDNIRCQGDSVFIQMPVFESSFSVLNDEGKWKGTWTRASSSKMLVLPFEAKKSSIRYPIINGVAKNNISGRWAVMFSSDTAKISTSTAEFVQKGNKITGTFMTPTGDYRYLEGVVTGNKLIMSGFDGAHAVLFEGETAGDKIVNGNFYSGPVYKEQWRAVKNNKALVKINESAMYVRAGEQKLNFSFPDLDSSMVSISDNRFKNKVVIIQLMGSWCPNCMDETAFLSDYYEKNKQRGIEMAALAYEYTTDFNRSRNSLLKFKKRFNIQYPILLTGVAVSDSLRTEKTLPQVTPIRVFPSSIILDKKGNVRKLDNGFVGPATGVHYEMYKKEFYKLIDALLSE